MILQVPVQMKPMAEKGKLIKSLYKKEIESLRDRFGAENEWWRA